MKNILSVFALIIALFVSTAEAKINCGLKKIPFGASAEKVVREYKFSVSEMPDNNVYFAIDAYGSEFCNKLPRESSAVLEFIDDQLVRVKLRLPGEKLVLKALAEDTFGEIKIKQNAAHKDAGNVQHHWKEEKLIAVYSSRSDNGAEEEYLEISSKGFEKLHAKLNSIMENGNGKQ